MTGGGEKPRKLKKSGARDARLAAALRENLRRRKARERGRGAPPQPENSSDVAEPSQSDENR